MQSDIILTDGICPLITIMRASDRCQYIGCSGKRHFDFQRETAYARMRMNTSQSNSDGSVSLHPLPSTYIRTCSRRFE